VTPTGQPSVYFLNAQEAPSWGGDRAPAIWSPSLGSQLSKRESGTGEWLPRFRKAKLGDILAHFHPLCFPGHIGYGHVSCTCVQHSP
jgi:hypothetical protein